MNLCKTNYQEVKKIFLIRYLGYIDNGIYQVLVIKLNLPQ